MSASTNWEDAYRAQTARVEELRRENAALREGNSRLHRLAYDMAAEMEHHGGEQAFDSAAQYRAARAKEGQL